MEKSINIPAPMDLTKLRADILAEDGKTLEVISESKRDILTYDNDECYGNREISYHLAKPTAKWLSSLFLCGSGCKEDVEKDYKKGIIDGLLKLDPNMLINLRRIIFFRDDDDIEEIVEAMGIDDYEWPEMADVSLGLMWFEQSAIIINLGLIEETEEEAVEEYLEDADDEDMTIEDAKLVLESQQAIDECVYVTVFHEVRHLGMMNPFLPESLYPASEATEEAVEAYGRAAFAAIAG